MTTAVVIGAGIGGLALAIRLQSAGVATILVEAREQPGGLAGVVRRDGYVFDTGPTTIADPEPFRALWALSGNDMAEDVRLLPVEPLCRFGWVDGTGFELAHNEAALRAEIGRHEPGDVAGYARFAAFAENVRHEGVEWSFPDFGAMLRAGPALVRSQAWRSAYGLVSRFVRNEKLREALTFRTLLAGGNPMSASALLAFPDRGQWSVESGMNRLVAGMAALFRRLGGEIRLGDAATRIGTLGDRVTAVETASGWRADCAMLAAGCDAVHACHDLLAGSAAAA
ncbi:MAG: FAD-dependent oxidoreductase, partial [Sphingomonas bacterium]